MEEGTAARVRAGGSPGRRCDRIGSDAVMVNSLGEKPRAAGCAGSTGGAGGRGLFIPVRRCAWSRWGVCTGTGVQPIVCPGVNARHF